MPEQSRIYRITMSDQGYRAIAELARDEDKPMAAVIREALEEHLRRKGKPTAMRVEWGGYRPRQEPEK